VSQSLIACLPLKEMANEGGGWPFTDPSKPAGYIAKSLLRSAPTQRKVIAAVCDGQTAPGRQGGQPGGPHISSAGL